jgi:hypothetical protein
MISANDNEDESEDPEAGKDSESESNDGLEDHRAFVQSLERKKGQGKASGPLTYRERLDRCKGSYRVRCKALSEQWDICDSLFIHITNDPSPGFLQAAVEFGIIEGTMLLVFNEADLDVYVDTAGQDEDSEEEEGDSPECDVMPSASSSKKRKAAASTTSTKRDRGRPKKQARAATSPTNRLFIAHLKGEDTGTGETFHEPGPGYLEFIDNDCVAFKGVCTMPGVDEDRVPFEGFKVDSKVATRASSC